MVVGVGRDNAGMVGASVPVARIPTRLTDLPEWRYKNLVWALMEHMSLAEIEWAALGHAHEPCRVGTMFARTPKDQLIRVGAVLGSDGAYHLMTAAGLACGEPDENEMVRHTVRYATYTDGETYSAQPAFGPVGGVDRWRVVERVHEWDVTLTDAVEDPSTVHPRQRCGFGRWPVFLNPNSKLGPIRRALVGRFGFDCQICHHLPGVVVDHDHLTGAVRGLLCADCNARVESCVHLSGCGFAEYLNDPPAASLALRYPGTPKKASDKRKEVMLGCTMTETPASIADWRWRPQPADFVSVERDGFYPRNYDFSAEIALAKAAITTALKCECGPDAGDGYRDLTYTGAVEVVRHKECGGVTTVVYRCPEGCQSVPGCWCPSCDMVTCRGCARAPLPHHPAGGYCGPCTDDL